MDITKTNAGNLLTSNYTYFLGVSNLEAPEKEAVIEKVRSILANPLLIEQRTAVQKGRYIVFTGDSKLDLGSPRTYCFSDDVDGHILVTIHKIGKDSYDNTDIHKWLFYLIL